ncbi:MAG TPA: sodium transporter, partial [Elusimicrobia bacterium]|nr:sodium transporter [Elusimicrobiota bacterium]
MFSRICDWFTRFLVIWVITAVVIAYFFPNYFVGLKLYTDWLFALTMFGIGAVLSPKDFQPIFKKPQKVLLGTLAQFGIMPLLGFLVAKSLNLPKDLALGVILAGAVPGAMASNVITYLAKADVALSIAFTTMSTFLSPVLTPTFTYLFARSFIRIDFWAMFFSIIKMVVLPVISGLVVKHYFGQKLERVVKVFPAMSALFIAFICGLVAALNKDYLASLTLLIFLA